MSEDSDGGYNVCIGIGAGKTILSGGKNLLIGRDAGANLTTGSRNIIIGNDILAPAPDTCDYINVGGHELKAGEPIDQIRLMEAIVSVMEAFSLRWE
jgi:hypothetical protein